MRVEAEDYAVVAVEAGGAGLLVRGGLADGDEAVGPCGWDLAGVKFVGEGAFDDVLGEDDGGEGALRGRDAGDAGDEEVGAGEVERESRPRAMTEAAARAVPTPVTRAKIPALSV